MLREVPGFVSPFHNQDDGMDGSDDGDDFAPTTDALDDVFGSGPSSPTAAAAAQSDYSHDLPAAQVSNSSSANAERSDVPRLRSTHVTSGYRDGIATSKASFVQAGFDEGFSLGAVLGSKAGWLVGVLEGVVRAVAAAASPASGPAATAEMQELFLRARDELGLKSLFGKDYFGEDGIWTYEVRGGRSEDDVTFREVADAHPVVARWEARIRQLESRFGLDLTSARPSPDKGREDGAGDDAS
ncbi:hypothetical protein MBLNU459_g2450t1 [Dothideomycetes sp. NU459]